MTESKYYELVRRLEDSLPEGTLDELNNHIERDYGGCESSTCSLRVAMEQGYSLHALELWLSSGAASKDTLALVKGIDREALAECSNYEASSMCDAVEHTDCPHCGAVVWEYSWHGKKVGCDSCGQDFEAPKAS